MPQGTRKIENVLEAAKWLFQIKESGKYGFLESAFSLIPMPTHAPEYFRSRPASPNSLKPSSRHWSHRVFLAALITQIIVFGTVRRATNGNCPIDFIVCAILNKKIPYFGKTENRRLEYHTAQRIAITGFEQRF